MTTVETDLKTKPLPTSLPSNISTPQSKSLSSKGKKVGKSVNQDKKNADKDKENASRNSIVVNGDEKQKSTPALSSSDKRKQPLTTRYSPPESKLGGHLFSPPGTGSPAYKIRRATEQKDRVKVGFVVANGPTVGMHVVKVSPGLPAEIAGLEEEDVIHVINGHQTLKVEDFRVIAANFRAGDVVPIKISRVERGKPKLLTLLMRLPLPNREDIGPSPQKEIARQVKMELARLKEEKERAEQEAIEKLKKEKQKLIADKKAKEAQMREELEKRKAAAREKRKEMKERQQQLKNEEVLLLQELRKRRAARKAELLSQAELTEKQKMEELAKVQEDEQKWTQVLQEEEKQREQEKKQKQEEIRQLKEEKKRKKRRTTKFT